ncbi:Protein STAR1 [Dichanthelium oligosanthes]|uniref:Protein STAR1 n=1 Tax=Dichanthelium oligosanthes TaxID=888268 RepID=A0A1E5W077_9POAL|nr:Protein STAR1 [Dichanthelium oligosanthes]
MASASAEQSPQTNKSVELLSGGKWTVTYSPNEESNGQEYLLDVEKMLADDDGGTAWAPERPPKIRVRGLSRRARASGEEILRGIDLDVPGGVVVGVIGPSGSGKTTLLRALNRLWEPAPGAVLLDGADICRLDVRALRRRVGMLFQQPAMFEDSRVGNIALIFLSEGTVAYNVRYGPQLRGKKLTEAEVQSLLTLVDLDPALSSKLASELSVGQAQRVLLLDEPTSALDPISTQNIEEAIVHLKKTRGLTTVMVSHSVKQIQRIADLACLLVAGEVVEVLVPSELSSAKHPVARRFLELSS